MTEGKTRIPALEGTQEEIDNYKEAFRMVQSPDWVKNSIPMDAAENSYLQEAADLEAQRWRCGARQRNIGPEVQDCDWPVCGCDPYASKVLDAIEESGFKIVRDEARGHQAPSATMAAYHGAKRQLRLKQAVEFALKAIDKRLSDGLDDDLGEALARLSGVYPALKRTEVECVRNHRIGCPGEDDDECCLNND